MGEGRLADKGFLKFEDFGSTYRYSAMISMEEYTRRFVKPLLNGLFDNSMKNMVTYFAEEEEISVKELKEIIKMIEKKCSEFVILLQLVKPLLKFYCY